MIYIRADGNDKIGLGHIMRCLAIADQIRRRGEQVTFLVADGNAVPVLERKKYSYVILNTDYRTMDAELPSLLAYLKVTHAKRILVDSYFVTSHYLGVLKERFFTAYIDDRNQFDYPVDLLINYNIYANEISYRGKVVSPHTLDDEFSDMEADMFGGHEDRECLLGSLYAPLRQEFVHTPYVPGEIVEDILITTGGSDTRNLSEKIARKLVELELVERLHYHIVSGPMNPNLPALKELEREFYNVHIHENVRNMAEVMMRCDIAVSAAGSTLYELSAVGVPFITFSFVENQKRGGETFGKMGAGYYAGDCETNGTDHVIENIAQGVKLFCNSRVERSAYAAKAKTLVDGTGAGRIARKIIG